MASLHHLRQLLPLMLPPMQQVGAPLADVMVAVGMQPSKGAVRRMIKVSTGL